MKAMILAAGKGTRVRPLTLTTPKPMLPILNQPILQSILKHLKNNQVTDVMINTSYLPSQIESYFGDGSAYGVSLAYSFEGHIDATGQVVDLPVGSAGGLRKVQQHSGFFDETFVVLCGDALFDLDLTEAVKFHKAHHALATIVCQQVPMEEVHKYGVVVCDTTGKIESFQEKPTQAEAKSNLINTGIYIFEPEVLAMIPSESEAEVFDIGSQLFPKLVEEKAAFFAYHQPFQWLDVGNVNDFWSINQAAIKGQINDYTIPGKRLDTLDAQYEGHVQIGNHIKVDWDSVKLQGDIFIGSGCRIGTNVSITGPCFIGANSVIEDNASLSQCQLKPYSHVAAHAQLDQVLYFGDDVLQFNLDGYTIASEQTMTQLSDCRVKR